MTNWMLWSRYGKRWHVSETKDGPPFCGKRMRWNKEIQANYDGGTFFRYGARVCVECRQRVSLNRG